MALEKQRRMIDLLLEKTKAGKIDWKATIDEKVFQVSFRDNTVQISLLGRDDDEVDYKITLRNAEGSVAENFTDIDLWEDQSHLPEDDRRSYYKIMGDLYELARRTALGSEKILNSILEELGDDKIPF